MKVIKAVVYYILCSVIKLISFVFFPCRAVGKENIPKDRQFILCPNHIAWCDFMPINMVYMRPMNYMAKAELFKNKIAGSVIGFFGAFPISRGTGDLSGMNHAGDLLKTDKPMCIFIEGTRTKNADCSPGRAKAGAVLLASKANCDVVPVAVVYKHGKPRIFAPVTVYFGKPVTAEQLKIGENQREDLRRASNTIMDSITAMWRAGTEKWQK